VTATAKLARLRLLLHELADGPEAQLVEFAARVEGLPVEIVEPGVHHLADPAKPAAGIRVLAGPPGISEAQYRRVHADDYEKRFRQQVGPLRAEIMKASVETIRAAVLREGPTKGAAVAIDVARQVAGIALR
jgi:hypothetical protein